MRIYSLSLGGQGKILQTCNKEEQDSLQSLVQPMSSVIAPERFTRVLDEGVKYLDDDRGAGLNLIGFSGIDEEAYFPMLELERKAEQAGYPILN